jgi:hypothetical protein
VAGLERSEAYTFRTRLGYGTKPYYGVSAFVEMENIAAAAKRNYFDGTTNNIYGLTPIADPTRTEVNQVFVKIDRPDWLGSKLIGGRQRIIFDDARFIGNVGWRQNEQTYDGLLAASSFGVDDLEFTYSYLGTVRRIFGNKSSQTSPPSLAGAPGSTRNWHSNSHLLNLDYAGVDSLKVTAFIYLLDLTNKYLENRGLASDPIFQSSQTYGFRGTGAYKFGSEEQWKAGYGFSYAYQADFAQNPQNYGAHYVKVDGDFGHSSFGTVGIGWERVASDDGNGVFRTPLATLHKFQGWADVFLDNGAAGGNLGVRDLYVTVAPALPWKLKMKLIYHYFTADFGNMKYGDEFDAVLSRPIGKYVDVLFKSAYFNARAGSNRPDDIYRVFMDFVVKF